MVVEYVRAMMQKRLVCRSGEERRLLAQQMVQDDQQFREIFHGLVRTVQLKKPVTFMIDFEIFGPILIMET